jgi:carboxylesterase type B
VLACVRPQRQSKHPAESNWPSYEPDGRATMVFNVQSKVINDWRGDERKLFGTLT